MNCTLPLPRSSFFTMSTATTVQLSANSENQEFPSFIIEFYVSRVYLPGGNYVGGRSRTRTTYKQFRQRCDHLVLETTSWSTISRMLSQVEVPFHVQPAMIAKISKAARAISARSRDLKILPLVVCITLLVRGCEDSRSDFYDGKDLEQVNRAAIKSLETVDDGSGSVEECCVICLDKIRAGPRHVRTPCKHVYHGECIVGWLKRSDSCPLCRFQLPEESSSS